MLTNCTSVIVGLVAALLLPPWALAAEGGQATVERGQRLFLDKKCSVCCAIAGKGNTKGALDGVGSRLEADEIRE